MKLNLFRVFMMSFKWSSICEANKKIDTKQATEWNERTEKRNAKFHNFMWTHFLIWHFINDKDQNNIHRDSRTKSRPFRMFYSIKTFENMSDIHFIFLSSFSCSLCMKIGFIFGFCGNENESNTHSWYRPVHHSNEHQTTDHRRLKFLAHWAECLFLFMSSSVSLFLGKIISTFISLD